MITTRQINVNLTKGKLKLRHVTTKDIDAGVRVEPPKEPIKPRGVSTTTLPDVADIAEKKRRDDIMAERKAQSKVEIITAPAIVKDGEGNLMPTITDEEIKLDIKDEKKIAIAKKKAQRIGFEKGDAVYQNEKGELATKEQLRKIAIAERMAKVRAAKAKKKDVKEDAR